MRFPGHDKDRLYLYIIISLIIHLSLILFLPFGFINGIVDGKGDSDRDFGFVQLVEFEEIKEEEITEKVVESKKYDKKEEKKEEPQKEEKATVKDISEKNNKTELEKKAEPKKNNTKKIETNKADEINTESKQKNEIISSEESDMEIEIAKENKNNKKEEVEEKKEIKQEENLEKVEKEKEIEPPPPPPPPPPPEAGDLINLSPKPYYPKDLVGQALSGEVGMRVSIDNLGNIKSVDVNTPSGIDAMDRNARLTIERGWKFKSYKKEYQIDINIKYSIDNNGDSKVDVKLGKINFSKVEG